LYDWEVLTQNGQCTSPQTAVNVTIQQVATPVVDDVTICEGESAILSASGGSDIIWFNTANEEIGTGASFETSPLYADTVFMVMNTENGCSGILIPVNVVVESCASAPELVSFQSSLIVSPNPTGGVFNISFNSLENDGVVIKLTDFQGKELNRKSVSAVEGKNDISMNLDKFAKGTYLITINYKGLQFLRKVIKN